MKEKIVGANYSYLIELTKREKKNLFQILSVHHKTRKKSVITNLNFIISELILPIINHPEIDNVISLSRTKGMKLFTESISAFKNKSWLNPLEKLLDEDRVIGGWNSNFKI